MKESGLKACIVLLSLFAGIAASAEPSPPPPAPRAAVDVSDLSLEGEIEGENIVFTLAFTAEVRERSARLPLVVGDVAYLDGTLPRGARLTHEGDRYDMELEGSRGFFGRGAARESISVRFASRPVKDNDWRRTSFAIPVASVRRLSVLCDRDDLEVRFPGALRVQRDKAADGKTRVTAFLGLGERFQVDWKPEVRKLEGERVVACEANTIVTASVGALRLDTVFTWRVIQGSMQRLAIELPDVNVTQVRGADIQDWRIDRPDGQRPSLAVQLSRPQEDVYRLQVESEMALAQFPCAFDLPVLVPAGVIRNSGFLMMGTDSAIKLKVDKALGLTQVDQAAFPAVALEGQNAAARGRPGRSVYAYQYASAPYTVTLAADDIVTAFSADDRLVLALEDRELVFTASVELDVKDAPAREIRIATDADPDWTVTGITGEQVAESDTEVRDEPADAAAGTAPRRLIVVPFRQAVSGAALVNVRMERTLADATESFAMPGFTVLDARSERGYVVVAAEKGVRLKAAESAGLREVHPGSAPMRVSGAQEAYRFKAPGWRLALAIQRAAPSIHSEVFHLVSLGEGVAYCSAAITYHVGGAPVQELKIRVPKEIQTVEFTGADIEGWTRAEDVCTVRLRSRVMGDYTLLATFDRQFTEYPADLPVGEVETVGTESEAGYIALASSASLNLPETAPLPDWIIRISRDEIPTAYASPVTDPILSAYKYVRPPHTVGVRVTPYETEQLLGQVADYIKLATRLSKDGESVTTASYYLKNASRQFLVLRLPEGGKLWSIRRVGEDGSRENVLSQESDAGLLIPVVRPRDPNTPLRIEVEYAERHGKLGLWRTGLRRVTFHGPSLPDTHATFVSWRVDVPERYAIAFAGGNLSAAKRGARGLLDALFAAGRIVAAVADGWGGYTLRDATGWPWRGQGGGEFARTISLSDDAPAALTLSVVPGWMGLGCSVWLAAGAAAAGLAILVAGLAIVRCAFVAALGWTVLAFGVSQTAAGRSLLGALLIVGLLFWAARAVVRLAARPFRGRRRFRVPPLPLPDLPPEPLGPAPAAGGPAAGETRPDAGGAAIGLLALTLAAGIAGAAAMASQTGDVAQASAAVLDRVELTVEGPSTARDAEKSATVRAVLEFESEAPVSFVVLPPGAVLTGFELGSKRLSLASREEGYVLVAERGGAYRATLEYQAPVTEAGGEWRMDLSLPPSLRNRVQLALPEGGLEVRADEAVLFKTREADSRTEAEAVFGAGGKAGFAWRPRVRKTGLEETVFFCELNTFVVLRSGVVDLANVARFQIAQGEVKQLSLRIPEGMSVTAVRAEGLATWSFAPETRMLEAVLEKPVSGEWVLTVVTQIACEGLPYAATLGVPSVSGAARQRGSLAIAAMEAVQVRVEETKALDPMNAEDFPAPAIEASGQAEELKQAGMSLRRAFRYQQAGDVKAVVHAERVLPEVRVVETGSLSIADERIVLSTQLALTVEKAGVFSVTLAAPPDYDVETLTGKDVSHWDESASASGRVVTVHFNRQVTGGTDVNLVLARTEKRIEARIPVPRVRLESARRHEGRLTVSAERGVRLMVDSHSGVDLKKAGESEVEQPGVLVFELLRPAWEIVLTTEVMAPVVKPEVLQIVDLSEGMLQCRAYVQYRIENAGIKTFQLRSPRPGLTLSVTGRNIARVHEADKEQGVWQVDLHNKVENQYAMSVSYPLAYDPAERQVKVLPLQPLNTDPPRGYLVVTGGGRVEVSAQGVAGGLKVEDARSIPASFGAGDLSGAILCYRTIRPDYDLVLSVVRHEAAGVLPAGIRQVRLASAVSASGKVLTRAALQIVVGEMRLLRMKLPNAGDRLWTVLVNGREVAASRDGELYCIPLDEAPGDMPTSLELVYAGSAVSAGLVARQKYEAPQFVGLPLNDIEWTFYVPPDRRYFRFGGTMERVRDRGAVMSFFNSEQYQEWNRDLRQASLQKAKEVLDAGQALARTGQQKQAQKAFQQALTYSQGEAGLNEDARVQLNNLNRQQVKIGLVNRRDAMRSSRNIIDEQTSEQAPAPQAAAGFRDGEYTPEYAQQVEQSLTAKDNQALDVVADKMLAQQAAAAGVVNAIRITMPDHGRKLRFSRAMLTDSAGALTVSFSVTRGGLLGAFGLLWPAALLLAALSWRLAARARRAAAM